MSPSLPVCPAAPWCALWSKCFTEVSQRGSHLKMRNEAGKTVIVPMHRELALGTLRSILRQAGLTTDAFVELL